MQAVTKKNAINALCRIYRLSSQPQKLGDFPRMSYEEAMRRFGSDKPDLRNPMEITDVADIVKDVDFKVFAGPANADDGRVAVIKVPGGASLSRKQIDDYGKYAAIYGAKGQNFTDVTLF